MAKKPNKHTISDLKQMQSLPLDAKIMMTKRRITEFVDIYGEEGVYISFSGGKDSTVLLHIVRSLYPNIKAVFINTGLEYPSVRTFALKKNNVVELRPEMIFRDVIINYGYPVISKEVAQTIWEARKNLNGATGKYLYRLEKLNGEHLDKNGKKSRYNMEKWKFLLDAPFLISHMCCNIMKKKPARQYENETKQKMILGTMAEESDLRKSQWIQNGCNAFDLKRPHSAPLSFWTENDILEYIKRYNLEIADAYGKVIIEKEENEQILVQEYLNDYRECKFCTTGCKRTGCIFCLFGIAREPERLLHLKEQEPKLYDYVMGGGEFNEDGIWQPTKEGLGYKFVIDWLNEHGNLNIQY